MNAPCAGLFRSLTRPGRRNLGGVKAALARKRPLRLISERPGKHNSTIRSPAREYKLNSREVHPGEAAVNSSDFKAELGELRAMVRALQQKVADLEQQGAVANAQYANPRTAPSYTKEGLTGMNFTPARGLFP